MSNEFNDLSDDIDNFAPDDGTSIASEPKQDSNHDAGTVIENKNIARKETRAVMTLRLTVLTMLAMVAAAVCWSVYFVGRNAEEDDFERDFISLGEKIVSTFAITLQQRFGVLNEFSMDLTAYVLNDNNTSWPFILVPDFENRGTVSARLADIISIGVVPRVETEQLDAWNEFANLYQGWRQEGFATRRRIPIEEVEMDPIYPKMISRANWSNPTAPEAGEGPYFPTWQRVPAIDFQNVNVNLISHKPYTTPLQFVMETKRPVLPKSYDYWDPSKHDARRDNFLKMLESYEGVYEDDPLVSMFYPVFATLNEEREEDKYVVGVIAAHIYWKTYFNNMLPPGADGVIVVLENTCDQQYTYQVNGENARFIGHGDLHDPKYDHLEAETNFESILEHMLGDPLNIGDEELADLAKQNVCFYSMRTYPSKQFENTYYTMRPVYHAVSLIFVFIFTSAVFVLYDFCVERRQKVVMKSAQQSGAIVSSLFPEIVRDRMYQEIEGKMKKKDDKQTWDVDQSNKGRRNAIANLYTDCTILFADLVGFTKWSSDRKPTEVFELLETIYGAFDRIALRRGVFKIETIGDCYVAATGLPEPQDDHAIMMTKFAHDCLQKLRDVIHDKLIDRLGQETENLSMRFGLHSGPVTAGVLKGERSRFQIFGDTVNTAARMESTGQKERIQVSQSTADLLIEAGKNTWVTKREDLVEAKGKGSLQTYWVSVPKNAITARSISTDSTRSFDELKSRLANRADKFSPTGIVLRRKSSMGGTESPTASQEAKETNEANETAGATNDDESTMYEI